MKFFQHFITILVLTSIKGEGEITNNEVEQENIAVTKFREYLRLRTDHPKPDYETAIKWLQKLCGELGFEYKLLRFEKPEEFVVIMSWIGSNSTLKSILLNSHMDVVPAYDEKWSYPPYEAQKINGDIYARGTQDSKAIGIEYLYALKNLKDVNFKPLRSIHVTFVPGEEVRGGGGMKPFTESKEFQDLNIGVGMDEGCAGDEEYYMFFSNKATWKLKMTAFGPSGHGASLFGDTAVGKIIKAANKMLAIRQAEIDKMIELNLSLGEANTLNLNILNCGNQENMIPAICTATYDIRLSPFDGDNIESFHAEISKICKEEEVEMIYLEKAEDLYVTSLDNSNDWWHSFKETLESLNTSAIPTLLPGKTDAMYVRKLGIPVFEFAPMKGIPILPHSEDEFIPESVFLDGIKVYEVMLQRFSSLESAYND